MSSVAEALSKKHLFDLNVSKPQARIGHQVDINDKQCIVAGGHRITRKGSAARRSQKQPIVRNLFTNVCSGVGLSEHQKKQTLIKQPLDMSQMKPKATATSSRTIELCKSILPPLSPNDADKKCLVLDLDETLRPGAEEFLIKMAKYYEIVVYTASFSKYADPLLDKLDPKGVIRYRLYREHCVQFENSCVKDLSLLNRDISQTIIIDNAPISYVFHPHNAIGCSSFIDNLSDCELESISRFLIKFHDVKDVREYLHIWDAKY
ncbi:unnamed protein product [Peronospora belbahrii]|uniref:Mitochondrial import inner membrane translocase subunit TIM50 n=1 Tax=Peronospora belbahrii TaxID=622444 RepID=A0AAU9KZ11_9STRA|nr:unnamed protein product [Peronospora belbahrii]CAH0515956.1 unnamed protein product [Peronospora belbahrii]